MQGLTLFNLNLTLSEILCPKRLVFKSDSYYYEAMQPAIRAGMKRKRGKPTKKSEDNA